MTLVLKQRDLFTSRWRKVLERDPLEDEIQQTLIKHLQLRCRPDVIYFHVPNGGYRHKYTGALLKALGVIPGVPDLMFVWPQLVSVAGLPHVQIMPRVLGLELKTRTGKLTAAQIAFAARMRRAGAIYETANTIDDALAILKQYGILV
jgi:hypothetical protein